MELLLLVCVGEGDDWWSEKRASSCRMLGSDLERILMRGVGGDGLLRVFCCGEEGLGGGISGKAGEEVWEIGGEMGAKAVKQTTC